MDHGEEIAALLKQLVEQSKENIAEYRRGLDLQRESYRKTADRQLQLDVAYRRLFAIYLILTIVVVVVGILCTVSVTLQVNAPPPAP